MKLVFNAGVTYRRNLNFVLYNEVVYVDDEIVGAIYEDKENDGFSIKKLVETLEDAKGVVERSDIDYLYIPA